MSGNASARSKTNPSPRRQSAAVLAQGRIARSSSAIAAEPLPGASAPPANPVADEMVAPPRRSIPRRPTHCTIGYRYYDVDHNGMRVARQVPSLRLHGLWLEGIGFAVGGKVRIRMVEGALLITTFPAQPSAEKKRRSRKPTL